jgi:hypothetical protein
MPEKAATIREDLPEYFYFYLGGRDFSTLLFEKTSGRRRYKSSEIKHSSSLGEGL